MSTLDTPDRNTFRSIAVGTEFRFSGYATIVRKESACTYSVVDGRCAGELAEIAPDCMGHPVTVTAAPKPAETPRQPAGPVYTAAGDSLLRDGRLIGAILLPKLPATEAARIRERVAYLLSHDAVPVA